MHIKFTSLFRALYSSCMLLIVAAIMTAAAKQPAHFGEIKDIETNVTLHDAGDILQLLVNWKDNLPKGTSYNVIVMAQNASECSEPPCSLYGISKGKEQLRIPAHPMPYVDQNECGYMFGCNYSLVVETSNAMVAHNTTVQIPYCILDTCSCRHAATLPKVELSVHIPSNDTIYVNWSVHKLTDSNKIPASSAFASRDQWQLHLKVSEQTNPSLSWGGKLIPITEHVYPLENVSAIMAQGAMNGSFKIKVPRQLDAKVVLNLRSYLIDELHCPGPEHQMKVQVPDFFKTEQALAKNDFDLTIALTIVSALFACTVLCALGYCWWRRKKAKLHASTTHKDDQYLSPFATIVDTMEDNLNYVDKYVEEAQAKGLADVFEVPHSAIHMGAEIGEGAFGRVYKAKALNLRRMRGPTVVAVKQLKRNPTSDEVAEFLGEIEMLKGVSTHHNIVCFLGCCTIRAPYLMIMEYVGRGDLLTYLRTVRHEVSNCKPKDANYVSCKPVEPKPSVKYIELKMSTQSVDSDAESERQPKQSVAETTYTTIDYEEHIEPFEYILNHKELHNFALQIANGMRFLEEQEITHRDLAARNVLIDDHKTLKISDFGLSRHGIYTNTKTRKLPLRWLSIEAIRDNVYSSKSDVWAYGVVLWEIGTLGASPYPTISNHELIPYLLAGKRLEKPEICTDQVYALMLQCWDEEADQRPSFAELYKALSPRTAYVDINSLSDDYVFPPIKDKDNNIN